MRPFIRTKNQSQEFINVSFVLLFMKSGSETINRRADFNRLKNSFKDKFRQEISDYVSEIGDDIIRSGRSSSSSNYSYKNFNYGNQNYNNSNNINNYFDINGNENKGGIKDKNFFRHSLMPSPNNTFNYNGNYEDNINDDGNSTGIVPLDDNELNSFEIPLLDDLSDSQSSKNQGSDDNDIVIVKKRKFGVRSRSPNSKISLKRPSPKGGNMKRSKSPSALAMRKGKNLDFLTQIPSNNTLNPNQIGKRPKSQITNDVPLINYRNQSEINPADKRYSIHFLSSPSTQSSSNTSFMNNSFRESPISNTSSHSKNKSKIPELRNFTPQKNIIRNNLETDDNEHRKSPNKNQKQQPSSNNERQLKTNNNKSPRKSRIPSPRRSPQKCSELSPSFAAKNAKSEADAKFNEKNFNYSIQKQIMATPSSPPDQSDSSPILPRIGIPQSDFLNTFMSMPSSSESSENQQYHPYQQNDVQNNGSLLLNSSQTLHFSNSNPDESLISFSPVDDKKKANQENSYLSFMFSSPKNNNNNNIVDDLIDFSDIPQPINNQNDIHANNLIIENLIPTFNSTFPANTIQNNVNEVEIEDKPKENKKPRLILASDCINIAKDNDIITIETFNKGYENDASYYHQKSSLNSSASDKETNNIQTPSNSISSSRNEPNALFISGDIVNSENEGNKTNNSSLNFTSIKVDSSTVNIPDFLPPSNQEIIKEDIGMNSLTTINSHPDELNKSNSSNTPLKQSTIDEPQTLPNQSKSSLIELSEKYQEGSFDSTTHPDDEEINLEEITVSPIPLEKLRQNEFINININNSKTVDNNISDVPKSPEFQNNNSHDESISTSNFENNDTNKEKEIDKMVPCDADDLIIDTILSESKDSFSENSLQYSAADSLLPVDDDDDYQNLSDAPLQNPSQSNESSHIDTECEFKEEEEESTILPNTDALKQNNFQKVFENDQIVFRMPSSMNLDDDTITESQSFFVQEEPISNRFNTGSIQKEDNKGPTNTEFCKPIHAQDSKNEPSAVESVPDDNKENQSSSNIESYYTQDIQIDEMSNESMSSKENIDSDELETKNSENFVTEDNEGLENALRTREFSNSLIRNLVYSICKIPQTKNKSSFRDENEDLIFAFQERMCSIVEVEVLSKNNKVINFFPLDLNKYIKDGKCILDDDEENNQSLNSSGHLTRTPRMMKKFNLRRPTPKKNLNNEETLPESPQLSPSSLCSSSSQSICSPSSINSNQSPQSIHSNSYQYSPPKPDQETKQEVSEESTSSEVSDDYKKNFKNLNENSAKKISFKRKYSLREIPKHKDNFERNTSNKENSLGEEDKSKHQNDESNRSYNSGLQRKGENNIKGSLKIHDDTSNIPSLKKKSPSRPSTIISNVEKEVIHEETTSDSSSTEPVKSMRKSQQTSKIPPPRKGTTKFSLDRHQLKSLATPPQQFHSCSSTMEDSNSLSPPLSPPIDQKDNNIKTKKQFSKLPKSSNLKNDKSGNVNHPLPPSGISNSSFSSNHKDMKKKIQPTQHQKTPYQEKNQINISSNNTKTSNTGIDNNITNSNYFSPKIQRKRTNHETPSQKESQNESSKVSQKEASQRRSQNPNLPRSPPRFNSQDTIEKPKLSAALVDSMAYDDASSYGDIDDNPSLESASPKSISITIIPEPKEDQKQQLEENHRTRRGSNIEVESNKKRQKMTSISTKNSGTPKFVKSSAPKFSNKPNSALRKIETPKSQQQKMLNLKHQNKKACSTAQQNHQATFQSHTMEEKETSDQSSESFRNNQQYNIASTVEQQTNQNETLRRTIPVRGKPQFSLKKPVKKLDKK